MSVKDKLHGKELYNCVMIYDYDLLLPNFGHCARWMRTMTTTRMETTVTIARG